MSNLETKYKRIEEKKKGLKRAVEELTTLNDLALAIGGSIDSEKIMRSIISKSIRALGAEQGDITLVGENGENTGHTLVRSMVSSNINHPLHLNHNLLGWMHKNMKPLMINKPRNDDRFQSVKWEDSVKSVLCAPLMAKSKMIGILTIYNKYGESGFSESDQRLLSIIAAQSAQVVENARLYQQEQNYHDMRREMELASGIQKKLLPSSPPVIEGYSIGGRNQTAKSVGGDYFDFIHVDESHLAICLGDISGKGVPAALLMANLQAILRGQVLHSHSPGEILKLANIQLYRNTDPEKFATLFFGILNTVSHTLHFSSGGHEFPFFIRSDKSCERLQSNGLPLGVMEISDYAEKTVVMKPGDCIFIFSDGITESMDSDDEELGEVRLKEILLSAGQDLYNPDKLIDRIFQESINHSSQKQLSDDMTALVLSRKP